MDHVQVEMACLCQPTMKKALSRTCPYFKPCQMKDPTYNKKEIASNPVWQLAFDMSEIDNDTAPIGWGRYSTLAGCLIQLYSIKRRKKIKFDS